MLLHRSDLNISENFRQFVSHFLAKLCKKFVNCSFKASRRKKKIVIFEFFSLSFAQIFMKFCQNFADNLENVEINF